MRIVAVLSGKGGVGKTTTCFGVALALKELGFKPGILDLDLENPSIAGKDGVTGLTRKDLHYPDEMIEPPLWAGIPIMSVSLMMPDDFEDTPAMLDEKRKWFIIRQLVKEVDWSGVDLLMVDMPPGTGEEVRGLLQLSPDAAVVVTGPQRISESAVRKVIVMAQEYRIPLLGILQNNTHATDGEAGRRLAELYRLPLLAEVPWSHNIPLSMESQVPFDHQHFLPVAQALAATVLAPPVTVQSSTEEDVELLREAEQWATGQDTPATVPARPPTTDGLGIFVGEPPEAETPADIQADTPPATPGDTPVYISGVFQDVTDAQWEELWPLLPEAFQDDRALFNGILWIFTTQNPWKEMPPRYGKFNTGRSRVTRMRGEGYWNNFLHKAKQFGYAPGMTEYSDDNTDPDDDAEILRDGDGAGEQGRPWGPAEGDAGEVDQQERSPEITEAAP